MARTPRGTSVPKTSGQGISRGIYQTDYKLGGGAIGGGVKKANVPKGPGAMGAERDYAKKAKGDFNVEFGGMFQTDDVKALGEAPPKSSIPDKRRENVGYKESGDKYKTSSEQRQGKKK